MELVSIQTNLARRLYRTLAFAITMFALALLGVISVIRPRKIEFTAIFEDKPGV